MPRRSTDAVARSGSQPEPVAPEASEPQPTDAAGEDAGVAPADVPQGIVAEDPTPEPDAQPSTEPAACPHGASAADCPLCALDADRPAAEPEPEPAPAEEAVDDAPASDDGALTDEEWDALVAEAPAEADLPLDEGEEITAERLDEDGVLIVVTSFGRKIGISPDGFLSVLTGPDIAVRVPPVPKPPRSSWKDPR